MLTGAIPEEYRRVTGCAQEGNRKVTGRLPEHTGGLPECTRGLPEFAQECQSRDSYVWEGSKIVLVGYWRKVGYRWKLA